MTNPITLFVGGVELVDFKTATVSYSLESFARSFAFEFSDKWLRTRDRPLPFREGDPCEVYVHGELVVDGFIDDVPISYDRKSHAITVSGRSWTGHMVDCSAVHKGGSWRKATLATLAKDLAAPFGCTAAVDPWASADAAEPFRQWAIEDEETAYDCLQRAAEMRGLFLTTGGGRQVVITKASGVVHPDALVFGKNILRGQRVGRFAERFSHYVVKSQSAGSETHFAEASTRTHHRVEDPQVLAYRPLILVSDGSGSKRELERRACFERNVRAGRSRRVTYDVHGHLSAAGRVWPVNELVPISDPFLGIDEPLLLVSVHLTYDSGGEKASLELSRPEAFDVLVPPPPKRKKKRKPGETEAMITAALAAADEGMMDG